MRRVWAVTLILWGVSGACAQEPETNVNERYTVESVEVSGGDQSRLDRATRRDLDGMVGKKFSQEKLDELGRLVRKAFPGRSVSVRISRGKTLDYVRVVFEIGRRSRAFDLAAPKALYSSRQGWSGEVDGSLRVGAQTFTAGVLSDGDARVERDTGVKARYENRELLSPKVGVSFEFQSLHQLWNGATETAAIEANPIGQPMDLYRARQSFEPLVTVALTRELSLTAGVSVQHLEMQFPAARTEAANSVVGTLRYDRQLEGSGSSKHRLEAGYGLRAATKVLDSDFAYTRHSGGFAYTMWRGSHQFTERFQAGWIVGVGPVFERFALGNSDTLRGWNKYDVAPLGGDRMVHNTVEYRYRPLRMFYDVGDAWVHTGPSKVRHSAGLGLQVGDFAILLAFPLRSGRAEPVILMGLNL